MAMPLKHQEVCSDLYCFPILCIYLDNAKAPLAIYGYVLLSWILHLPQSSANTSVVQVDVIPWRKMVPDQTSIVMEQIVHKYDYFHLILDFWQGIGLHDFKWNTSRNFLA